MPTVSQAHDLAIARHAAHAGEHEAGLRACERLLSRMLPPKVEQEARAARTWYIPLAASLFAGWRVFALECPPARPGWSTFNPTVVPDRRGGLLVLVRSSNYSIDPSGAYVVPPEDMGDRGPWIRTRHMLLGLDIDEGAPVGLSREPVELLGPDWPENECQITGLEDIRLRWVGPRIVASGTALNVAGLPTAENGWPIARIATATLLPDAGILCDFECLPEPFPGRCEKNWVPIDGLVHWLYSAWEDGRVATVDRRHVNGRPVDEWRVEAQAESPAALRHLRGRSQLIALPESVGGGWLAVMGEATDDGRRMYDHRFVRFDIGGDAQGLAPVSWSPPFTFSARRSIEFCAGLALVDRHLVASYGLRDEVAMLATVPLDSVLAMLGSIPC